MKTLVTAALLALCFTTGFTCSKNTPEAEQQPAAVQAAPSQEQMAAPAATGSENGAVAPAPSGEVAPVAQPAEGQPAPTK